MSVLKTDVITSIKVLVYLLIGLVLTIKVLSVIYEGFGIPFVGNVWVNWFGVSYLIYFFYSIICGLFLKNNNDLFKKRITSIFFWLFFIGAVYAVFIPFFKGVNPF